MVVRSHRRQRWVRPQRPWEAWLAVPDHSEPGRAGTGAGAAGSTASFLRLSDAIRRLVSPVSRCWPRVLDGCGPRRPGSLAGPEQGHGALLGAESGDAARGCGGNEDEAMKGFEQAYCLSSRYCAGRERRHARVCLLRLGPPLGAATTPP